ncbi:MAG: UvrD-helicase domain-containing protein [Cetobacterium sp.]
MKWSPYSEALFDTWKSIASNIVVSACPGSGKTTNIGHICSELISLEDRTLYLAFNKSIVEEAKEKLPQHINIMTLNGLGHRAVCNEFGRVKLDGNKVYKIIRDTVKQGRLETKSEYDERVGNINKAVALMKINNDLLEADFEEMCDTFDIDTYPGIYNDCDRVLARSDKQTDVIDFNDQLRFPVVYDLMTSTYDNILVDESQDLNSIQAALVAKARGKYCFVGDPHQAIYGFRGAMSNSMQFLKKEFNAVELPLKLSYRCSKAVVREAAALFDDIEALDNAIEGEVSTASSLASIVDLKMNDLVLCRLNAPLLKYAYTLLKANVPCFVKGRDIGEGLIKLIDKLGAVTVGNLYDALAQWRYTEISKAQVKENDAKIQKVSDRADSLMIFMSQCQQSDAVESVKTKISLLFANGKGVQLSTVHKAKGLEADNVYILDHDLMPLQWATKAWEIEQEKNIQYVAVTRAKSKLVYM